MKTIIRNILIIIFCCLFFFIILPLFSQKAGGGEENLERYPISQKTVIEDNRHIALLGTEMEFPLKITDLPDEFHIEDMYYDEMTDGIDAGDYFHCYLLNKNNEEIAYIRVSNLNQSRADSPEGMTITYLEATSFTHDGKEYAVPFDIKGGVGIGSSYDEVKEVFPDIHMDEKEEYSIEKLQLGIQTVTLEFTAGKVYKMSVQAY
ncbi:MAG: hypothetical protein NC300_01445 [Bacteroidales bacterium]|nr:hypothetical protein [Clostridium sp.]MCM1202789.1 hypothetical protein [Bacteroidales bacterium]